MQRNIILKLTAFFLVTVIAAVLCGTAAFAADLTLLIGSDDFGDNQTLTLGKNGAVNYVVEDGMLRMTTTSANNSWGTSVSFTIPGNTQKVTSVVLRIKLADTDTKDSRNFAVNNTTFAVTKEWQTLTVNLSSKNYTTASLQHDGADATIYVDSIELYTTIENVSEPQIEASVPSSGSEIAPTDFITVTYNNEMSDAVTDVSNYSLNGGIESVESIEETAERTYKIIFSDVLSEFTDYTLTIGSLEDIYRQVMPETQISFSTTAYAKPSVISTEPVNGVFGVSNGDAIEFTFDQSIDASAASASLSDEGSCTVSSSGSTVTVVLNGLKLNTAYTLCLNGVKNSKNKIADEYVYEFITAEEKSYIYKNTFDTSDDVSKKIYKANTIQSLAHDSAEGYAAAGALNVVTGQYGQLHPAENGVIIKLEAGKTYIISFVAKTNDTGLGFWFMDGRGNNKPYYDAKIGAEYTKFSYRFTETESVNAPYIQFDKAGSCFIDDFMIEEEKAATLMETSDLYSSEVKKLDKSELKFIFNKAIDKSTVTSGSITVNDSAVSITEVGDNYIKINLGDNLEHGMDYTLKLNIKDALGLDVGIVREFVWMYAVSGEMSLVKSGSNYVLNVNNIKNHSASEQKATAIILVYKDGQMIDGAFKEVSIGANQSLNEPITVEMTASEGEAIGFFWDSLRTRKAYLTPVTAN